MRVDSDLCRPLTHIRDTCNMSVLIRRSYPIKRISLSSRPRRSSARPSHHECGIVSCVSRGVRNGRAKDHPHPSRTSHKRPAERSLPSRRRQSRAVDAIGEPSSRRHARIAWPCRRAQAQPPHGESRKSPLRCANVTNDGDLGHSMEHVDAVRHARAVEPQPRAAIHLQPPSVAGGLQTCSER